MNGVSHLFCVDVGRWTPRGTILNVSDGQCSLTVSVPYLIRPKYGLMHSVHKYVNLGMAV